MQSYEIVIWQVIVSPHMTSLASELALLGHRVTYIARHAITTDRIQQGWTVPVVVGVTVNLISSTDEALALLAKFDRRVLHLTQGVRRNDYVSSIIEALRVRGSWWAAMIETVDQRFFLGWLKSAIYRRSLAPPRGPKAVLAIGHSTRSWVGDLGFSEEQVWPFAYFVAPPETLNLSSTINGSRVKFVFVGHIVHRKRFDLLVAACRTLPRGSFHITAIGKDADSSQVTNVAQREFGKESVTLIGALPMANVPNVVAGCDYLVLPSDHDGWGAVVTEALMVGVPAICSSACGAATAVVASNSGGLFRAGNHLGLASVLQRCVEDGPPERLKRVQLAEWARCFGSPIGALYLTAILDHLHGIGERPKPPWMPGAAFS